MFNHSNESKERPSVKRKKICIAKGGERELPGIVAYSYNLSTQAKAERSQVQSQPGLCNEFQVETSKSQLLSRSCFKNIVKEMYIICF